MFSRVFGDQDSIDILKDFLQSILTDIKIEKIESVKQAHIDKTELDKKFIRLDILAVLNNGIKVDIEMQKKNYHNTIPRSLYYLDKLSADDLTPKQKYEDSSKKIGIWILGYDIFEPDSPFHEVAKLKRDFNNEVLTDKLELHYIQLPKFKKQCTKISTELEKWLFFIINDDLEEIKMIDNKNIQDAESKLEVLNADEYAKEIAERIADAERNELSALDYARNEGKTESEKKIIKKLIEKNMDISFIKELTGVSEEEILRIKNEL